MVQPGTADFSIGLEYGVPGLAAAYAATGVTAVKPQLEFVTWGNLEPAPDHWQWGPLDNLVNEYQAAGFERMQLMLSAESPWASRALGRDLLPKDEYFDSYVGYVTNVVERYDDDGVDDAPGLRYPVHQYGVELEFSQFFPGGAPDYLKLLRLAYPAVHAADELAQVLLVAVLLNDVFDSPGSGALDPAEVLRRLDQTPPFRKSAADIQAILAACDAYDIVDFHSLGNYTEIPLTADWLRAQLAAGGCAKPLWIGDAFGMSPLVAYNQRPFAPATAATRAAVVSTLQAVADPADPAHASALAWLQAEMARSVVKKAVVSAGAGIAGINIGNLEDWSTRVPAADKLLVLGLGAAPFMGLAETSLGTDFPGGRLPFKGAPFGRSRIAGAWRPAAFAVQLLASRIAGYSQVSQLDLGSGVWAYRFDRPDGPVWVLWFDDGAIHLPGDPVAAMTVNLDIGSPNARLTRTPTDSAEGAPLTKAVSAPGSSLSLTLDSTPIFVTLQ